MRIPVLVEPSRDGRFIARPKDPSPWRGFGSTEEEAVRELQKVADESIRTPAKEYFIEIDDKAHPVLRQALDSWEDPRYQDYLACMSENRRRMDEEPSSE